MQAPGTLSRCQAWLPKPEFDKVYWTGIKHQKSDAQFQEMTTETAKTSFHDVLLRKTGAVVDKTGKNEKEDNSDKGNTFYIFRDWDHEASKL